MISASHYKETNDIGLGHNLTSSNKSLNHAAYVHVVAKVINLAFIIELTITIYFLDVHDIALPPKMNIHTM